MTQRQPPASTERELQEAYELGVSDTEAKLLPFLGIGRVHFDRSLPVFEATDKYERELLDYRREIYRDLARARVSERHSRERLDDLITRGPEDIRRAAARATTKVGRLARREWARHSAAQAQRDAELRVQDELNRVRAGKALLAVASDQLDRVRENLDAGLAARERYLEIRAGRRRDSEHITTARAYRKAAFYDEDRDRELGWDPGAGRPGGTPYGQEWTYEHPEDPGIVTKWWLFWLDNGEIFALDVTYGADSSRPRDADEEVLLLGRVPRPGTYDEPDFLRDLVRTTQPEERNTLILAAHAVAEQQRQTRAAEHRE